MFETAALFPGGQARQFSASSRRHRMLNKKKLLGEVVWVILDQFRTAVFFCCCRCGHVGNALALSIMSTPMLCARAVDL
jgi:hypothetical protein